jgi:hypothetical protein
MYEEYEIGIMLASLVAGIVTILIIFRFLDRVPQETVSVAPPPPPTFSDSE